MFKSKDGIRFKGSKKEDRDREIKKIGYGSMLPTLHKIDEINPKVKEYFVYGKKAEWYQNIKEEWEEGHYKYGYEAIDLTLKILRENFSDTEVKSRIVEMIGFDGEEELYTREDLRPEWLPEKFNSAEDMAQAYSELEQKLGGNQQTEEKYRK